MQNYLTKYQYIAANRSSGNHNETMAIENFQKFFGLPVTGELNEDTMYETTKPRCGDPDVDISGGRRKRYSLTGSNGGKPLSRIISLTGRICHTLIKLES